MLGCRVFGGGEAKLMVLRSRREIACQACKYTTWAKERLAAVCAPPWDYKKWARDMSSKWTLSLPRHRAELVVHDPVGRRWIRVFHWHVQLALMSHYWA